MANPIPNSDSPRPGLNGDRLSRLAALSAARGRALQEAAAPEGNGGWPNGQAAHADRPDDDSGDHVRPGHTPAGDDAEVLRRENDELRMSLTQAQQQLDEARQLEETWVERQKQYESLLEEKSEVIREQHRRLLEAQREQDHRPKADTPREDELLQLHEELELERAQLKEDEESLMKQMRDMELQMSRERAELARQRNELQRLHTEIRHELELAARDATLRERLAPLQRRAQDTMNRRGGAPANGSAPPPPAAPAGTPPPPSSEVTKRPADSGIFRRLFGG